MVDKNTIRQILGGLMHTPQLLSETDKYTLITDDFSSIFEKTIYAAIFNLYQNGAERITSIDIDNYLDTNPTSKALFEKNNGIEYLEDISELAQVDNFSFYYNRLKKLNAIRDLKQLGFDTSGVYCEDLLDPKAKEINDAFEEKSLPDIFDTFKVRLVNVETKYNVGDVASTIRASDGLAKLVEDLRLNPEVGAALQGSVFNTIARGARKGKYYIRSAGSGTGKTRAAVGDACHLAYPVRFNIEEWKWELTGSNERTLFIMTEQEADEIQTMILSYLTGINEEKIILGQYNKSEAEVIKQAIKVISHFKDNLMLTQMPNPTITQIKAVVRQNVLVHGIENVFYDYIHISPSLLNEFRDLRLRTDEVLLMFSTALKELAAELGVFVMSSTQISDKGEKGEIKDESSIRGAKAIPDKADFAVILSRVTAEDNELLQRIVPSDRPIPNQVIDVFKVRRSKYGQLRIWIYHDLGTCRREDIFVTDARMNPITNLVPMKFSFTHPQENEWKGLIKTLNEKL